jgi:hypothetical protein
MLGTRIELVQSEVPRDFKYSDYLDQGGYFMRGLLENGPSVFFYRVQI